MKPAALILASAILVLSAGCSDDTAPRRFDDRPFPGVGSNYKVTPGDPLVDMPFRPNSRAYKSPQSLAPSGTGPGDANMGLAALKRMLRLDRPLTIGTLESKSASPAAGAGGAQPGGSANVTPTPITHPGKP